MFEGPPFKSCSACQTPNLGVLSIDGGVLSRRCRACRATVPEPLPPVSKKVVYLDQFAISQVFKLRTGRLPADSNSYAFWVAADKAIRRAFFLQQAVFPASDIHAKETLVWSSADELRSAHEMLAGGISYRRLEEIELRQIAPLAQAFARGEPPPRLVRTVGDILVGELNGWIPRFHVGVAVDYSRFATAARANRDRAADEIAALASDWAREKPTFKAVFERELGAFGTANLQSLRRVLARVAAAEAVGDGLELFEATHTPLYLQFRMLADLFRSMGMDEAEAYDTVVRFWLWPGNAHLPFHRLSAGLFASLARKMAAGQKKAPGRGTLNDFDAITYFAPYVDAMFIDRECGGLIRDLPKDPGDLVRAEIFTPSSGGAFLEYLNGLAGAASPEVKAYAAELYDVA